MELSGDSITAKGSSEIGRLDEGRGVVNLGGEGAGLGGAADNGKKSLKVSPSAPVSTTRLESRLRSAAS